MHQTAETFFQSLKGKRVAVCGVGISNRPLIELLCRYGAKVTACDKREASALGETAEHLQRLGAVLKTGPDYLENLDAQIIFRTPGMPYYLPQLTQYRSDGVTVTSEMEVFFDLCPAKLIAVTGSDGKTTTTTLIAEMLREAGYRVHLGGNIGKALLPGIEEITPQDMAVVELSSFQLISMRCAPDVSVVTNVAPNHLDVHKDMAEYIAAKRNIFLHQNAFSKTVLGLDNEITRTFQDEVRGRLFWFSRRERPRFGSYLADDGNLYLNTRAGSICLMKREDIRLPGIHNVENYLAAIAAVCEYVTPAQMREVARTFGGVEHRIEFVRELQGVRWYNDSIATSPTRTIAGLRSFDQKLIIIAGGYDKKIPYLPLAPEINKHVKVLVLTGATAEKIEQAVVEHPTYDPSQLQILHAADLEEAVRLARAAAVPGDVVSLSPASASFDKYPNFEARGKHFKQLVNALK